VYRAIFKLCLIMATGPAMAADWSCSDPDTLPQQGLNFCALQDSKKADAELNQVWATLFPKLKTWDRDTIPQWQGLPDAVLNAQRAWIAYRDAHCSAEGFRYRGGSIEPLIYHACRARVTRERTLQLKDYLEN